MHRSGSFEQKRAPPPPMIPPQMEGSAALGSTRMNPHVPPELNIGAVLPGVDRPSGGEMLPMVRSSSSSTDPMIVLCVASHEDPRFDDTIPIPNLTPDPTPPAKKITKPGGHGITRLTFGRSTPNIRSSCRLGSAGHKSGGHLLSKGQLGRVGRRTRSFERSLRHGECFGQRCT